MGVAAPLLWNQSELFWLVAHLTSPLKAQGGARQFWVV